MSDDAAPAPKAQKESRLRQAVDFSGLLAFGLAFLVLRLRGLDGDEALVNATWFLVAGSAVGVAIGLIVEKRLALMPLLVGGCTVFGLLTLLTATAVGEGQGHGAEPVAGGRPDRRRPATNSAEGLLGTVIPSMTGRGVR
jgi:hypothetical protein